MSWYDDTLAIVFFEAGHDECNDLKGLILPGNLDNFSGILVQYRRRNTFNGLF